MKMKKRLFGLLLAFIAGSMLFSSCKKDTNELILGTWSNTAQSFEITINGQQNLTEGCLTMQFKENKVLVSDSRVNGVPSWTPYSLDYVDGQLILHLVTPSLHTEGGNFIIEELSEKQLVIAPMIENIDWSFRYFMVRAEN